MRTISATLTAAGKSASASPYLRVRAIRKIGATGRLDWERIYTGVEAENLAGIAQAGDGSILRIRVTAGNQVQIQRTASPSGASDWATWPAAAGANVTTVAICASGANAWAFYGPNVGGEIYACSSTDNGATWSAWAAITPAGVATHALAAAISGSGEVLAVYERSNTVYTIKRSGGAWGAETAWTNTVATITGLAMVYSSDYNLIITGTQVTTTHPKVWSCIYGDGDAYAVGTWGPLTEAAAASAGSGVSFHYPALSQPETYRCFFQEYYSGTTSYKRPYHTHTPPSVNFVDAVWREPVPFNLEPATYGLAMAYTTGSYVYASTVAGVWRAPVVSGTGLDITTRVAHLVATASLDGGKATIRLDNSDGAYATLGSGATLELQRGSLLNIDPGYKTTAGSEVSGSGPPYWIESISYTHTTRKGQPMAELVIEAVDAWGLLSYWRARSQKTWASGGTSVIGILTWILARVGLQAAATGQTSTALDNLKPAFTIHPGENGATAVLRLLALVPDRIIMKSTTAYLRDPRAADASQYTYGSDHQILEAEYRTHTQEVNHAYVLGLTHFSESFSWTEIGLVFNRTAQTHDINLTTAADCLARSAAQLRDQVLASRADAITVRPHVGQEILDVVSVTDATAGLATAKRRVIGTRLEYQPAKGVYLQTLTLGDA